MTNIFKIFISAMLLMFSLCAVAQTSSTTVTTTTTTTTTVNGTDTTVVTKTVTSTLSSDPFTMLGAAFQNVLADTTLMKRFTNAVIAASDTVIAGGKVLYEAAKVKGAQAYQSLAESTKLTPAQADSIRAALNSATAKIDDFLKSLTDTSNNK